ncbi:MAG: hypothetical protein HYZ53_29000 [Planctomycetes bacterium]|nr:hypothetical protein [Planctomycetota bacterium]
MDLNDRIQCKICGRFFASLTFHLIRTHHVAPDAYKKEFNERRIVSEALCYKRSQNALEMGWGKNSWTDARVLETIRRMAGAGKSLSATDLKGRSLLIAGTNHFGSWDAALSAAGVDPASVRRIEPHGSWSRERVLAEIEQLEAGGHDLSPLNMTKMNVQLYSASWTYCGGWPAALKAAGIDWRKHYVKERTKWTRESTLQAIRDEQAAGRSLKRGDVIARWPALHHAVSRFFKGGWRVAFREAGLDPDAHRAIRFWTEERVLAALRERRTAGKSLVLNVVRSEDSGLIQAVKTRYGKWSAALEAAGIGVEANPGMV